MLLQTLIIIMVVCALVAVEISNLTLSIIAVGVVGAILSLVFFMLNMTEIAIIQLLSVVALTWIFLATVKKNSLPSFKDRNIAVSIAVLILGVIFILLCGKCIDGVQKFGMPEMKIIKICTDGNITTEAVMLFTAVLGIFTIIRKKGHKKIEE